MTTLNYRHSLETINKQLLAAKNERLTFSMVDGKPVYTLREFNEVSGSLTQVCGYFYSASDAVEYVNKAINGK